MKQRRSSLVSKIALATAIAGSTIAGAEESPRAKKVSLGTGFDTTKQIAFNIGYEREIKKNVAVGFGLSSSGSAGKNKLSEVSSDYLLDSPDKRLFESRGYGSLSADRSSKLVSLSLRALFGKPDSIQVGIEGTLGRYSQTTNILGKWKPSGYRSELEWDPNEVAQTDRVVGLAMGIGGLIDFTIDPFDGGTGSFGFEVGAGIKKYSGLSGPATEFADINKPYFTINMKFGYY